MLVIMAVTAMECLLWRHPARPIGLCTCRASALYAFGLLQVMQADWMAWACCAQPWSMARRTVRPLCGDAPYRETDAGLVNVGTVWNVYDKLLQGLMASWRSYLQLPNLKFHVVQVCSVGTTWTYWHAITPHTAQSAASGTCSSPSSSFIS